MTPGIADFWLNASDLGSLIACILGSTLLALAIRGPALIREITDNRVKMREQARHDKDLDARLATEQREQERIDKLGEVHLAALHELVQRWRSQPEILFLLSLLSERAEEAAPEKVSKAA